VLVVGELLGLELELSFTLARFAAFFLPRDFLPSRKTKKVGYPASDKTRTIG
jgi:hypothetical protein